MKVKKQFSISEIKKYLSTNNIQCGPISHRKNKSCIYVDICEKNKVKNNAENRKRIYNLWMKLYNSSTPTKKNNSNDPEIQQLEEKSAEKSYERRKKKFARKLQYH